MWTLIKRLQKFENESAITNTLRIVKELIWNNIINDMNEIWPRIQIIFEKKELVEKAIEAISATNLELRDIPSMTNRIIKFLNSRNKYELEEMGVAEIIETIIQVKKVITKKNLNV